MHAKKYGTTYFRFNNLSHKKRKKIVPWWGWGDSHAGTRPRDTGTWSGMSR
jgi:hypothetical protein